MGSCQWPSVKVEVCSEDIHIIVIIPRTVSFIEAKTVEGRERGMQTDSCVSGVCSGSALGKQKERKDECTGDAQIEVQPSSLSGGLDPTPFMPPK